MIHKIIFITILYICITISVQGASPPTSQEIGNTVSNLWIKSELEKLGNYIVELYKNNPNYLPAILASSFYDKIYKGDIVSHHKKLYLINDITEKNEILNTNTAFIGLFSSIIMIDNSTLKHHINMGISNFQTQTSGENNSLKIRDIMGDTLPPDLLILFLTPEVYIEFDSNKVKKSGQLLAKASTDHKINILSTGSFNNELSANVQYSIKSPTSILEPDATNEINGLTKRNWLSVLMIAGGGALLVMTLLYAFWPQQK